MTVAQHIQQLRQLVLEYPPAAHLPLILHYRGQRDQLDGIHHEQEIESVHLNLYDTKVVVEVQQ